MHTILPNVYHACKSVGVTLSLLLAQSLMISVHAKRLPLMPTHPSLET